MGLPRINVRRKGPIRAFLTPNPPAYGWALRHQVKKKPVKLVNGDVLICHREVTEAEASPGPGPKGGEGAEPVGPVLHLRGGERGGK